MKVEITPDPKLSKIDHLFLIVAESEKPPRDVVGARAAQKAIEGSGFGGRSDETITVVGEEPKKITLLGVGKLDAFTLRVLRGALYNAAKIAKKHRDRSIAVVLPYN